MKKPKDTKLILELLACLGLFILFILAAWGMVSCEKVFQSWESEYSREESIEQARVSKNPDVTEQYQTVTRKKIEKTINGNSYRLYYKVHFGRYALLDDTIYPEKDVEYYIEVTPNMFDEVEIGDTIDIINYKKVDQPEPSE